MPTARLFDNCWYRHPDVLGGNGVSRTRAVVATTQVMPRRPGRSGIDLNRFHHVLAPMLRLARSARGRIRGERLGATGVAPCF
jgi:hypothetical protein